jgi:hypothetical protein
VAGEDLFERVPVAGDGCAVDCSAREAAGEEEETVKPAGASSSFDDSNHSAKRSSCGQSRET